MKRREKACKGCLHYKAKACTRLVHKEYCPVTGELKTLGKRDPFKERRFGLLSYFLMTCGREGRFHVLRTD